MRKAIFAGPYPKRAHRRQSIMIVHAGSPHIDVGWVKDANLNDFGAKTRCPK